MMLPLSTIEGQETEEVQTRPPEKGGETYVGRKLWPRSFSRVCPQAPRASPESALSGCQGKAPGPPSRSCPGSTRDPGSSCGAMMLPLSTIGGQGREEVQTRPPQRRGYVLTSNPECRAPPPRALKFSSLLSVVFLSFQPGFCFTFYMDSNDSEFDSQPSPGSSRAGSKYTSPSKPRTKYQEIQAWECPLCCLSVLYIS
uniref:Uncharacterized protein n=1 Tax=Moschus moschiferus TaxID=68415 RepID=A0A8C6CLH3_MOSMO